MSKKKETKKPWWKNIEKIFNRDHESGSEDAKIGRNISKVATSLELSPENAKMLKEKAKQQAEALRQELLQSTQAVTPWAAKTIPGDDKFPVMKSKVVQKSKSPASLLTSKSASTAAKLDTSSSSASSGLDPPPIDENEETARNSVRTSSFQMLIEDMARDADKLQVDQKKRKWLRSLSPAELVNLRHRDEELWRLLTRENTLMTIAASGATDEDRKRLKSQSKRSAPRIRFNEKLEIFLAPVGQAYKPNEKTTAQIGQIELEKKRPVL